MMKLLSCRYNMDTAIQLLMQQLHRWIAYRQYTIYMLH